MVLLHSTLAVLHSTTTWLYFFSPCTMVLLHSTLAILHSTTLHYLYLQTLSLVQSTCRLYLGSTSLVHHGSTSLHPACTSLYYTTLSLLADSTLALLESTWQERWKRAGDRKTGDNENPSRLNVKTCKPMSTPSIYHGSTWLFTGLDSTMTIFHSILDSTSGYLDFT